jgi:hypothetical protein
VGAPGGPRRTASHRQLCLAIRFQAVGSRYLRDLGKKEEARLRSQGVFAVGSCTIRVVLWRPSTTWLGSLSRCPR